MVWQKGPEPGVGAPAGPCWAAARGCAAEDMSPTPSGLLGAQSYPSALKGWGVNAPAMPCEVASGGPSAASMADPCVWPRWNRPTVPSVPTRPPGCGSAVGAEDGPGRALDPGLALPDGERPWGAGSPAVGRGAAHPARRAHRSTAASGVRVILRRSAGGRGRLRAAAGRSLSVGGPARRVPTMVAREPPSCGEKSWTLRPL